MLTQSRITYYTMTTTSLVFFLNGRKIVEDAPDTTATLLQYLRRKLLLSGTKEGCGHGGCGSCTVMVSRLDSNTGAISHYSVNACLFPLCAAHGLAITTVEGVGSPRAGLHDVQKRLIESHGLQCGFCTPGFVMSAYTLLRNKPRPTREEVERALEGNLCRCTGYRPILDALKPFTQEVCGLGEQCCRNQTDKGTQSSSESASDTSDGSQVPIFPPELQLNKAYQTDSVTLTGPQGTWTRPSSLQELIELRYQHQGAPVVMGNTTGVMMRGTQPVILYGAHVPELGQVKVTERGLMIGAAVTMATLGTKVTRVMDDADILDDKKGHLNCLLNMVRRYGADQIRNVATVGGSLLSGRSNSDVIVLLTALGATVTLKSARGERPAALMGLQVAPNEVIINVTVPWSSKNSWYEFYKQAERRTFSLAVINSGMMLELSDDGTVKNIRLCFGGVGKTVIQTTTAMKFAIGKQWDESTRQGIIDRLSVEIQNCANPDQYKQYVAVAFFFKFFAKVQVDRTNMASDLLMSLPSAPATSTVLFDPCTEPGQTQDDAVGRPVPNVSSEAVVTGEAGYLDDKPKLDGELFLSLVLSRRAHARVVSVDPSPALTIPGVHGYVDHRDIPGTNLWGPVFQEEEVFVSEKVLYYGQPIGGIVAETREVAKKAAALVNVQYEDLTPILTLEDAIAQDSFIGDITTVTSGDIEKAFSESDRVIEGEYRSGHQEHFYLETHVSLAVPHLENNEIEVYSSCHNMWCLQDNLARVLNLTQNKLTCKVRRLGGSFGGKDTRTVMAAAPAAVAAQKYRRAVRCVLPREVDMLITGKRMEFLAKYKVGVQKNGTISAVDVKMYGNGGISTDMSHLIMATARDHFDACYRFGCANFEGRICKTNLPSNPAFRGFGGPEACLMTEEILFRVACDLNIPQEMVRERNMYQEGDVTPGGVKLENCTIIDLWKQCMEQSGYTARMKDVEHFNSTNTWRKRGLAMTTVKFGIGFEHLFLNQGIALVHIYRDGTVLVTHGGIEMGQGINTKIIQVASRVLGIPLSKIYTNETGTHTVPNAIPTVGSMGADLYAPAVQDACTILMGRLDALRAANPNISWEKMIQKAFFTGVKLSATGFSRTKKSPDELKKNPYDYYSYGVACTEVEIDVLTGENQVLQTDIVYDVGKSLNPAIDVGQIEGGFIQGLGMMTSEYIEPDGSGRVPNCSPLSYKIPNVTSIPRTFNVTLMKNHDYVTTVYSSKAIGEPPLLLSISVIMALKEAVKSARAQIGLQGHFRLDSPATIQRIRAACGDQLKTASK